MYGNSGFGNRSGGRGGFQQRFSPVKEGEEYNVKIETVGEKGDGLARIKGLVIFVPNTQANEECKIKITRVLKKVAFGDKLGPADGPVVVEDSKDEKKEESTVEEIEQPQEEETYDTSNDSESFGDEEGDAEESTVEEIEEPAEDKKKEE